MKDSAILICWKLKKMIEMLKKAKGMDLVADYCFENLSFVMKE